MRLLRSFVAGFAIPVVTLASCGETPLSPESLGLRMTVTAEPPVFRVGESTVVTVVVRNEGEMVRRVTDGTCHILLGVLDERGEVVGPRASVCSLQSIVLELAPGEQVEFTKSWGGEQMMTDASGASVALPPATYRVRATVLAAGSSMRKEIPVRIEP